MRAPVEQAIFGDAEQCVETVCSVEEGPGTFAFADVAGDGGDGNERVLLGVGPVITPIKKLPRPLSASSHLATKKDWASLFVDMAIQNGTTSDAIDDTLDFSDLEAK